MPGHGEKLTRHQEAAIAALLAQPTLRKAAVACGIAEKTLRRWLDIGAFAEAYRLARRRAFDQAVGELQRHALRAVRTLARNLKAAKASDQNRAADLILSHARDYAELDDLAKRIEAIEALLRQPEQAKEPPAIATEDDQL